MQGRLACPQLDAEDSGGVGAEYVSFSMAESSGRSMIRSAQCAGVHHGKSVPSITRSGPTSLMSLANSSSVGARGAPYHSVTPLVSKMVLGYASATSFVWRQEPLPRWAMMSLSWGKAL